jgi:hypothetical protein
MGRGPTHRTPYKQVGWCRFGGAAVLAASHGFLRDPGRVCGGLGACLAPERKSTACTARTRPWLDRGPAANGNFAREFGRSGGSTRRGWVGPAPKRPPRRAVFASRLPGARCRACAGAASASHSRCRSDSIYLPPPPPPRTRVAAIVFVVTLIEQKKGNQVTWQAPHPS